MMELIRLWSFVRFVKRQDIKLHEFIRSPENEKYRGWIAKGYVHKDKTIAAFAKKRHWWAWDKITEGYAANICEHAIKERYLVQSGQKDDRTRSILLTKEGHRFSSGIFGFVEVLYGIYPKATAIVFGGISAGSTISFIAAVAKVIYSLFVSSHTGMSLPN